MSVQPDTKGAFLAWAKAQGAITAICPANRISGVLPSATGMPDYFISAIKTGGYGSATYVPLGKPRLDIWCYGPTPYEAERLWRTVHGLLLPVGRQGVGFVAAHVRVLDVQPEASEREDISPEGWPYVWVPYIFTISEVAV